MAKALYGYIAATDPRVTAHLTAENRRLRDRVAELEDHILRLESENDALAAAVHDADGHAASMLRIPEQLQPERMQPV